MKTATKRTRKPRQARKPNGFTTGSPSANGWRLVTQVSDLGEVRKVWIMGLILRYERVMTAGVGATSTSTYAIAFDDTGTRYKRLCDAEAAVEGLR